MKPLLLFLSTFTFVFILSCSKGHGDPEPNRPRPDTLFTGWNRVSLSDKSALTDIFFINNTGFAVSTSGLLRSIDGGDTWTKVITTDGLINVGMGSESNAVIVRLPDQLICTHNGGNTFDTVAVADFSLTDVFFVSPTIAYAFGKSCWKTTDAGSHWIRLMDFTSDHDYKVPYFLDEQNGYVTTKNGMYQTTNGGVNWQQLSSTAANFDLEAFGNVFFVNANHGFIANRDHVFATNNGSNSFDTLYTGGAFYHDVHFLNDNTGYITDGRRIFKTVNGGTTWIKEVALGEETFIELHFTDANHGWACGTGGTILKFKN